MATYNGSNVVAGAPQDISPERKLEAVKHLAAYKREADDARKSGLNPRDDKMRQNLDLYFNRHDFSDKQDWQAKETMPEVPNYVDRFAAAVKEALVAAPDGFYTIHDPYDTERDMSDAIKRLTDTWLSTCGRNQLGHTLPFPAVFEEQVKLGAITACCAVVTWKNDVPGGRVAIDAHDPRFVWLDPTNRNLYRTRRVEIDRVDLLKMAKMKSSKGNPIFDPNELDRLLTNRVAGRPIDDNLVRSESTGIGQEISSNRGPVVLDEYIATVLGDDGTLIGEEGSLWVVADDGYLVRGPERNPYWHGKDWMVYTPLVTVPLSPYGRSYMEDFGGVSHTFTELTNLILDAVHTTSLNAFAVVPSALENPAQAHTGVWPNKTFLLQDGYRPEDFAKSLELGRLDRSAVEVWQALKNELSEAASINEIGLGQLPQKSHIAASAVSLADQSSSAVVRSVAQTIETRLVDPVLDLVWKTGIQHADFNDPRVQAALGPEWAYTMAARRQEFAARPLTFQARGISTMIQKSKMLQSILQLFQIIGQSEPLAAAFLQKVDMDKFLSLLFNLAGVDPSKLTLSHREQMMRQVASPMMAAAGGAAPTPGAEAAVGGLPAAMGVAR